MDEIQHPTPQTPAEDWDDSIREALDLYDASLNVFPVIRASKEPYGSHSILTTTRLHRPSLPALVRGSNIAVMTGRLSGNLFVLDCDSEGSFQRIGHGLATLSIAAWPRNGVDGGQYWLRCQDGEVANAKVGDVDVLGNRKYTVAPPSLHPSGMVYEWLHRAGPQPPLVSLDTLGVLGLGLETVGRRRARGKMHELPVVADRVLVEQDTSAYHSDSEAEFAVCLSLIGVGYGDADIMYLLSLFPPPHYAKVGETHFKRSVLDQARMKQRPPDRASSRRPGDPHSSAFMRWAEARPWPGRTGNTDRAVYLALCQRMRMDGGIPFRGSVREVAELAGVNKETACAALSRLVKAGLVHLEGQDGAARSARYSLAVHVLSEYVPVAQEPVCPPPASGENQSQTRTVGEAYALVGVSVRNSEAHDVWHSLALGKSALACWTTLQAAPGLTEAEIVARTGKTRPTVRLALGKLDGHGLAHADDGHWRAVDVSVAVLDQIAQEQGTLGRAEGRVQRHREERERHATAIIEAQKRNWLARQ